MAERRWPTAEGMICAVLEGTPGVAGAVASGKPAIAATGAVPLVIDYVKSRFKQPPGEAPAVYAALAQQAFP
jgi:hypothetical protein